MGEIETGILTEQADSSIDTLAINTPFSRFVKRLLDVILALLMIIFIAPWLFPLVIVAILIDSRGNPFFLQKRTGRDLKTFYCLKFRTMVINKDSHRIQVQVNDRRITRIGKFLRKYHLDELPQVFNVLAGSMSIVGPRPHMLRQNVQFSKISSSYHLRHIVKPGMTGLAQVRGFHGIVFNADHYYSRLNSDLEYIQNWSLFTDIRIFVITTIQILFQR
ncbi:MAG: sugar transferase [Bacteroidales bacterium]|nr:sugar transferase [Bacteroidales bacterium]